MSSVGALYGVEPNGMTNGTVTFIWADEAVVTLLKNGVAMNYMSGQELTEDGVFKCNVQKRMIPLR